MNQQLSLETPIQFFFGVDSKDYFRALAYAVWILEYGTHASKVISTKSEFALKKKLSIVRLDRSGVLLAVPIKRVLFEHFRLKYGACKKVVVSKFFTAISQINHEYRLLMFSLAYVCVKNRRHKMIWNPFEYPKN